MKLAESKIVITGGATGIGKATAIHCASQGAQVIIGDVNDGDANATVEQIQSSGGKAWYFTTDVSNEEDVASLISKAEAQMGGVNALVTAAGIAKDSLVSVDQILTDEWQKHLDINLTGSFLAAKHTVPAMRKAGGGVIVMIASGAGVKGPSSIVSYGASKGGVNGLAMTLEPKLSQENIRVNVICPGNISTPLKRGIIEQQVEIIGDAANREGQIAGLGAPDGVAKIIGFLLSKDADYLRGAVFTR